MIHHQGLAGCKAQNGMESLHRFVSSIVRFVKDESLYSQKITTCLVSQVSYCQDFLGLFGTGVGELLLYGSGAGTLACLRTSTTHRHECRRGRLRVCATITSMNSVTQSYYFIPNSVRIFGSFSPTAKRSWHVAQSFEIVRPSALVRLPS